MHIVQIIDSLGIGGAQKLLITFVKEARARNIKSTIISLHCDRDTPIPDELRALGASVHSFPSRSLLDPRRVWRIARFLHGARCDVVHTHLTYTNIIGTLAARLAGVPAVASLHNVIEDPVLYHPIRNFLETLMLRYGSSRVVAVGSVVAEVNQKRLRDKQLAVIPNAVSVLPAISPAERTALRAELVGDPSRPLLISVGRLTPQKGYNDLLAIFASLHETHPSAALIIAGGGHLRAELAAQITSLKLEGHVILLGVRHDVPRLLAASDIFVSSSHWEGLPVAVLEAMAVGLPVVATDVGEAPRVVVNGTGFTIPLGDKAGFVTTLRSLLDHPESIQTLGAAAQAQIERYYSATVWLDRLLTLYQEAGALQGARLHPQEVIR
jgi:glycosyltransferase involved in cell wall biosynthesis